MKFPPFYIHIQNYIIKNHENDINYLDFWVNYNIPVNKIYAQKNFSVKINTNQLSELDKKIKEKINFMDRKYYGVKNTKILVILFCKENLK